MRQEPWGKMELLLVMRIDEPKFLVSYNEPTFVYRLSNNSMLVRHSFMLISSFIVPFSSLHVFSNNLYKGFDNK